MSCDTRCHFILQRGINSVLNAFFQLAISTTRLWVPVAIALVVYANSLTTIAAARPILQASPKGQADPAPSTVLSGTVQSSIYLPLVTRGSSAAVYWGALVDGQAPSTENMQPGGVFDVFEMRAQKKM